TRSAGPWQPIWRRCRHGRAEGRRGNSRPGARGTRRWAALDGALARGCSRRGMQRRTALQRSRAGARATAAAGPSSHWPRGTNHDQDASPRLRSRRPTMPAPHYLDDLNSEQRSAVEHCVAGRGANVAGPLLVIAGAGSGKTNTLAHRVAHLIVHGADPQRILLLTFSRRAAAEMQRRVARIVERALAAASGARIGWSGTFHAIGARLLRLNAPAIGLDPSFTVHDREDSADLMNLVRHRLGLSEQK